MYKITYIHKDETTENPLYIPGDPDYCLTDGQLSVECGKSGELDVSLPMDNPARSDIMCLTDEVIVYRNGEEYWRGRPVTVQMDFDMTGKLTCEGILSYLYDTYYPPFEFEGSPKEFLQSVLNNHNSCVDERKQFVLGDVTVEDNNDYINRSSIYYNRSLEVLTEKLVNDSLGGYFRVRVEDGVRYLDYLSNYGTQASQPVEYGENILDIAQEIEYSDLATVILPLGARLEDEDGLETDERLTIASVNGGSIYYEDPGAVAEYGWICVEAEWDDVTIASNLLDKAKTYLEQCTSAVSSFTVNAVDLSLVDSQYEAINLGDYVLIHSLPQGISQYAELTSQTIHFLHPENDVLQFGSQNASLTENANSSNRSVQSALGSMSMRVTNLSADVITAVYANLENIVASTITTEYIQAAVAELGYVTADYVNATFLTATEADLRYATIYELDAFSADIESLTAFAENVYVLLGGTGSFGDLTSIHLTTDNAVIDEAVIVSAIADTIIADMITAGYINTDVITVQSEDGGITIIGNQMQIVDGQLIFYDENGTVRMQVGQDASGNFSFILYDETGTGIMIDSEGIHESAVPDGLIVDSMVADTAAIQGSKLDIASVAECLTEDGSLVVSAAQVTINDQTLDAWYVTVQEWGDSTVIMQTQLTEIQGLIDAKVWETDIESYVDPIKGEITELTDQYSEIRMDVDTIISEVGDITTTESAHYLELSTQISSLEVTTSSITSTVQDIEQQILNMDAIDDSKVYWCLWESGTIAPPFESDLTPAICGEAVCGTTICGVTDVSTFWTETEPTAGEGQYKWYYYYYRYINGDELILGPYCETDDYARSQIAGAYTQIEQLSNSITATVVDLTNEITSQIEMLSDSISISVDGGLGSRASIVMTVGDETLQQTLDLSDVRQAFADDNSAVVIQAGTVAFYSDTFICDSEYFSVTANGTITATKGTIGGFTIGTSSIYNGKSSYSSTADGVYIGTSGISLGDGFSVSNSGTLTATKGYVGGFTIGTNKIYGGDASAGETIVMQVPNTSETSNRYWCFACGGSSHSNYSDCKFRVGTSGSVHGTKLYIGETDDTEERSIIARNSYGRVDLQVTSGGRLGLYIQSDSDYLVSRRSTGENQFGNSDRTAQIYGSTITLSTDTTVNGRIIIGKNARALRLTSTSGSEISALYMTTSDYVRLGSTNYPLILYGSNVYLNGTTTAVTSDRKFKDDVTGLEFLPDRDTLFDRLTPREYTTTFDTERHMGFVYQEVVEAEEESGMDPSDYGLTASFTDDDGETVGAIRYEEIIPLLVYEVQQLKAKINELGGE